MTIATNYPAPTSKRTQAAKRIAPEAKYPTPDPFFRHAHFGAKMQKALNAIHRVMATQDVARQDRIVARLILRFMSDAHCDGRATPHTDDVLRKWANREPHVKATQRTRRAVKR